VKITPYVGLPLLYLAHCGEIRETGVWYRNFEYEIERLRGLDYYEDLFNPRGIILDLRHTRMQALIASTASRPIESAEASRASEIERRRRPACSVQGTEFVRYLALAADQFIVKRGADYSVIADYHWFTDWGRDTMISLAGLTLSTGRPDLARGVLLSFARSVDRGMLPNRFADAGEAPEYNTADATLWFFEAVRGYLANTGDLEFIGKEIYNVLADIVRWYECRTRCGIKVDEDGLVVGGQPGMRLTWMDARIGDCVVTPRSGKAVDIQALWYNALRVMEDVSRRLSRGAPWGAPSRRRSRWRGSGHLYRSQSDFGDEPISQNGIAGRRMSDRRDCRASPAHSIRPA
jgi:predicted glycogen debranching enzyme